MTRDQHIEMLITKYDLLYESRLAKVETTLEKMGLRLDDKFSSLENTCKEIKTDLRWMLGMGIAYGGIMLGLMAKGFHWLQ